MCSISLCLFFFFCNDTSPTEIYTLSLHDALPISLELRELVGGEESSSRRRRVVPSKNLCVETTWRQLCRSEEHTSELQSRGHLVCRLLLEKKKRKTNICNSIIIKRPHR